jgi:integrase
LPASILACLGAIEQRGASMRIRNARLAAIKACCRCLECRLPAALEPIRPLQAIPRKKADAALLAWLMRAGLRALRAAPDPRTRDGIRGRAMLNPAYGCGLRGSGLTDLQLTDCDRRNPASLPVTSKGAARAPPGALEGNARRARGLAAPARSGWRRGAVPQPCGAFTKLGLRRLVPRPPPPKADFAAPEAFRTTSPKPQSRQFRSLRGAKRAPRRSPATCRAGPSDCSGGTP